MSDESAGEVYQLDPHSRMTVEECLAYSLRRCDGVQDVLVISYDADGDLLVRSSAMSRKDAVWMLLEALDYARSK